MVREKSDANASKYREEGNKLYRREQFFEAILAYNKSLCLAASNDVKASAFANRSAIYLRLELYEECLENVQWARKCGYAESKLAKLEEREEICKTYLSKQTEDPLDDARDFFKLSYKRNETIPFIVDSLELKKDEKFGRGIFAVHALKAGDIIAIEDPFERDLSSECKYKRCRNCMATNKLNLLPHPEFTGIMYCSDDCLAEIQKGINTELIEFPDCDLPRTKEELEDIDDLIELIRYGKMSLATCGRPIADDELKTIFDIDWRKSTRLEKRRKQLQCYMEMKVYYSAKTKSSPAMDKRVQNRMTINLTHINYPSMRTINNGSCVSIFGSLLNHSCDMNISHIFVDSKLVFFVLKPIKAGEQLYRCYGNYYITKPTEQRQQRLKEEYGFTCQCNACQSNYPMLNHLPVYDKNFKAPADIESLTTSADAKKQFDSNCDYVNNYNLQVPSLEYAMTIFQILLLMNYIVGFFTWPCMPKKNSKKN